MNFDFVQKKVGIWGFGIVGKSLVHFFVRFNSHITIYEKQRLSENDLQLLNKLNVRIVYESEQTPELFFDYQDILFVSTGIDIRPFKKYHHKIITELDLFYHFFKKPIIAITGTLGKTTTTMLISQLLSLHNYRVATGGNIGIGLTDFLENKELYDVAVIEVSSFQLEYCKLFAPDIAVWTNFFPNHLDRHNTVEDYFDAKLNILRHQQVHQKALLPHKIITHLPDNLFCQISVIDHNKKSLSRYSRFFIEKNRVYFQKDVSNRKIATVPATASGFQENILTALAAAYSFNSSIYWKLDASLSLSHRMEYVGTFHEITFYNDSKATISQATQAALQKLSAQPIILFLGGLSKGTDRTVFIKTIPVHVKHILCFGKEASLLQKLCKHYNFSVSVHSTLEEAFNYCLELMQPRDVVLFSPGGSSFDLFKNYAHRGEQFKALVKEWVHEQQNNL